MRLFILILPVFPLFASVTIIENTPQRLTFKWELGTVDTVSVSDSGRPFTTLSFDGANIMMGDYGEAAIPGYSLYAGIPLSGPVKVGFTPGSVRTVRLDNPLKRHPDKTVLNANEPRTDIRPAASWITNPQYTWFRSLRAAHIVICPVRYDEQSQTVQLLESGECTIEFPRSSNASKSPSRISDYQRMLSRLLLNYDVAHAWAAPLTRSLGKAADPYPFTYNQQVYTFKIGDGHNGFNEMTVRENGILKLPGSQIRRLFSNDSAIIATGRLALYGSWKGPLSMAASDVGGIPAGVREIPLFRYDANQNNKVDDKDYFLAVVTGLSDWQYENEGREWRVKVDPYDDDRTYWLALKSSGNGATMRKYLQPPGAFDTTENFTNRIAFKQSELKYVRIVEGIPREEEALGFVWVALKTGNREFRYTLDLPYCDTTDSGTIRFFSFDWKDASVTVDATIGADSICTNCMMDNDYTINRWGDRSLHLVMTNPATSNYFQLDHIRVSYRQRLDAGRDTVRMQVFSAIDSFPTTYRLSNIGGKSVCIIRVPEDEDSITFVDTVTGNEYVWSDSGLTGVRYFIAGESGFLKLDDTTFQPPDRSSETGFFASNLRETGNEADYIIVTPSVFSTQAKRLAEHKSRHGFSAPRVVKVEDIFTDFSGGNFDPTAIRNFLAYAQRNWKGGEMLDYALLMGSGHYDYKQVKTNEPNFIPPAEVTGFNYPFSIGLNCVDDYYAFLETKDTSAMSIALGRLPCVTESEAAAMVDKIIEVEDPQKADWGSWRNSILLVADDDMQGLHDDLIRGDYGHHASSERVSGIIDVFRPSLTVRKTYLFDYEWNSNWEKPDASRALINEINSGVGYVNYFGHGSEVYWTDEHILAPDIVSQMTNEKRYPVIFSFSCSVGKFDLPGNVSLGERLLLLPRGGAIGSFAGTRSASASGNEALAMSIYRALFDTLETHSIGMGILKAKSLHHDVNSLIYVLFGDPSIKLVNPQRKVSIEVADSSGMPRDTFMALEQIKIKGTILDDQGQVDRGYGSLESAYVQVGIFNAPELAKRKDNGLDTNVWYYQPGRPVFSGKFAVRNGRFEQTLTLPPNLSFKKPGTKVSAFAWETSKNALGYNKSLIFDGTKPQEQSADSLGPRITVRPVYEVTNMASTSASFCDRITSSLPLNCEIELYDPSGINVMGSGPDEGLTVEIPGVLARQNINHKFQFSEGDFKRGNAVLSFEEESIKTGTHELIITSQDLLGYVAKVVVTLEITDENEPRLDHVFNTPNPVRMGQTTRFFFYPSTQQPYLNARFTVKIYSLSGKLLRIFKNARNGEIWNLSDQNEYSLPPNIYLYQVAGYYATGKQVKSKIQKLVIHPPR
jgi:hypothetical protein